MRRRKGQANVTALRDEAREQAALAMYAQMLTPDLDEMANVAYARLLAAVGQLGLPAPPPLSEMGQSAAYTPLDGWLDQCGL